MANELNLEIELAAALRTTAAPPQAWIDAAVATRQDGGDFDAVTLLQEA